MAELDKKIQKALTDLVQAVLEAQEKKNLERVDMLITNAIKQLKMSRFKPDQATCISLIYLSRLKPKIFSQSSAIKEVLKGLLRRDNGPSNIKGKNDIFLPILSANILLASCDSLEVRTLVLSKIEQWLSSNQKPTDQIQHLLAVLCIKCLNDKQTIATLVDMRHNWLQYLEDNYDLYGSVPEDLCSSIRRLLPFESSSEYLIVYLKFLIKHDSDIISLGKELSKFVNERPMSLDCMLKEQEHGGLLVKMIMKVFIKLIAHLKKSHLGNATGEQNRSVEETKTTTTTTKSATMSANCHRLTEGNYRSNFAARADERTSERDELVGGRALIYRALRSYRRALCAPTQSAPIIIIITAESAKTYLAADYNCNSEPRLRLPAGSAPTGPQLNSTQLGLARLDERRRLPRRALSGADVFVLLLD